MRAYEEQIEAIEAMGGQLVIMASRALARAAKSPADYARVYGRILRQLKQPAIIHWLGEMFDPALAGYWGSADHGAAMENCLGVIRDNAAKIDGVKISLLSKEKEIEMRRQLPAGVRMYTGDDFNYAELIAGDEQGYSDALLGIFDAIAPAASAGLARLATGDLQGFHGILEPTVPLSRHIFKAPTRFYKTGVVFLAWLNGLQEHFIMVGGQESARSLLHLAELFRLADQGARAARPRPRGVAHAFAARRAWVCLNGAADPAAVDESGHAARAVRLSRVCGSLRPPRHHRHQSLARQGCGLRAAGVRPPHQGPRSARFRLLPRRAISGSRPPPSARRSSTTTSA